MSLDEVNIPKSQIHSERPQWVKSCLSYYPWYLSFPNSKMVSLSRALVPSKELCVIIPQEGDESINSFSCFYLAKLPLHFLIDFDQEVCPARIQRSDIRVQYIVPLQVFCSVWLFNTLNIEYCIDQDIYAAAHFLPFQNFKSKLETILSQVNATEAYTSVIQPS